MERWRFGELEKWSNGELKRKELVKIFYKIEILNELFTLHFMSCSRRFIGRHRTMTFTFSAIFYTHARRRSSVSSSSLRNSIYTHWVSVFKRETPFCAQKKKKITKNRTKIATHMDFFFRNQKFISHNFFFVQ